MRLVDTVACHRGDDPTLADYPDGGTSRHAEEVATAATSRAPRRRVGIVAALATAVGVATVVAFGGSASSPPPASPMTAGSVFGVTSAIAGPCYELFAIGAHVVGVDAVSYGRLIFGEAASTGRTPNQLVHDQLDAVRWALASGAPARPEMMAAVQAGEDRADAALCPS